MPTTRSSSRPGGFFIHPPPPGTRYPPDQAPPLTRHPLPWDQAYPPGPDTPQDQAPSPLWTEFLTHACENITLPQTSFAGGNKKNSNGRVAFSNASHSIKALVGQKHLTLETTQPTKTIHTSFVRSYCSVIANPISTKLFTEVA